MTTEILALLIVTLCLTVMNTFLIICLLYDAAAIKTKLERRNQ